MFSDLSHLTTLSRIPLHHFVHLGGLSYGDYVEVLEVHMLDLYIFTYKSMCIYREYQENQVFLGYNLIHIIYSYYNKLCVVLSSVKYNKKNQLITHIN